MYRMKYLSHYLNAQYNPKTYNQVSKEFKKLADLYFIFKDREIIFKGNQTEIDNYMEIINGLKGRN